MRDAQKVQEAELRQAIINCNKRNAVIQIHSKTGEFMLSCPKCIESKNRGQKSTIIHEYSAASLQDAATFLRRITLNNNSGFRPRSFSAVCRHVPTHFLSIHQAVFSVKKDHL